MDRLNAGAIRILGLGFIVVLSGCGNSKSSGTTIKGGTAGLVISALNYGARRPGETRSPSATNTNNGAGGVGAPSMGILSGPPLAMNVFLQSIQLTQSSGSPVTLYSNTTANSLASQVGGTAISVTGCKLALSSGNLDLSVCSGLSSLTVPAGTYTGMTVNFAEVGEIQGCLKGQFSMVPNSGASAYSGTHSYPSPFPSTAFSLTTDPSSPQMQISTDYTFCTRSDKHYYQAETASTTAIGMNSDYLNANSHFSGSTPDFVAIDLSAGNQSAKTMAQLLAGTVALTSTTLPTQNGSATLTLSVDMNRMLEFFGNERQDFNPPNPDMHTGTSYFFTTKFTPVGSQNATSAVSAYAGAVGTVEGYQWTATKSGQTSAAGWYTLFLDSSGNYIGGSMYEDDDNELTIMKGNATLTGSLTTGATLTMDIAGTCTGFTATALSGTGTCSLTATGSGDGSTYTVNYTRLL